ncbi:hypothetical protein PR003_g25899 [Phytophthora rubi]|uniref:Uncharacterized protein n=1 Tax=Phytophthora rubi TaxID=129364 RepID=A0A6A4CGD0_9STRA|nr:hypothetical protein PR003_g25899 [Phytophthora rubi]
MKTRGGRTTADTSRQDQDDDSSERTAMMNVPITSSAILPPWVKDISHASLVQWKKKRHTQSLHAVQPLERTSARR